MSRESFSPRLREIAVLCCMLLLGSLTLVADLPSAEPSSREDDAPAGDRTKGKAAAKPDDEEEEANTEASYTVPDTKDVAELSAFIDKIRTYRPKSQEDALLHRKLAAPAIRQAAERVLKYEKDKSSEAYQQASLMLLAARASTVREAKPAEQRALIQDVAARLKSEDQLQQNVGLAMMIVRNLEHAGQPKASADAYASFGAVLKQNQDKQLAELGNRFEGAARRVDLVGKPMKVEGQTVDGKPFDWSEYQGKVVLVDFFATWCGPCRQELPNVKRAYRLYHDRGFDVVAVSIDDDADALKEFLAEQKLPWVTLHDKDDQGNHPLSDYYGIIGVPTVMLVGKNGKVASLNARGPELQELLTELIGPAGDEDQAEADDADETDKAPARPPASPASEKPKAAPGGAKSPKTK